MTAPQHYTGDTGPSATSSNLHRAPTNLFGILVSAMALSSCLNTPPTLSIDPIKIEKKAEDERTAEVVAATGAVTRERLTSSTSISAPLGRTLAEPFSSTEPPKLSGESISVNMEGIRLPAFVNTVFGEILGVSFEIESTVAQREQLVSLRVVTPQAPNDFFNVVRQVLGNYGISVIYQNGIYRIVESASRKEDIPRIVRSRAMPNVPNDMRPVFYYAPLSAIPSGLMQSWLQQSLKDRLQYQTLPLANGLLLLGKPEDIDAARETIAILDQPALAGTKSLRISPAFWSAEKMASQLLEVLVAEGYSVAIGGNNNSSIKIVPVRALNIIIVFCPDETVSRHVLDWATELDQPGQTVESKGIFYHPVYNTKAEDIATIIENLMGGGGSSAGGVQSTLGGGSNAMGGGLTSTTLGSSLSNNTGLGTTEQREPGSGGRRVIVDKQRNALIFQGTAEEYAQFRALVDQMDHSPLEVLIEATVAEITLREGESLGSVLSFDDRAAAAAARSVIKSDAGILVNLVRDTGQFTASLQALADRSRVNILSSPRLVTSSGKPATIQIGTQVPIISTQQTSPDGQVGGTSTILQDIQYRSTGVSLSIDPTINSNRRVELVIQQEVSEAQVNNVSEVQSPLILTRGISTTLSLDDAETVLLGGLISENYSNAENGIPILKDIPLLGNLFKTTSKGRNRTELIVLLTPYIIESSETARALRDAFRDQLTGFNEVPSKPPASAPSAESSVPTP